MNAFYVRKSKQNLRSWLPLSVIILVLVFFAVGSGQLADSNNAWEYQIVSNALDRSITQCYALEGIYPPNIEYLRLNYGFTYNTDHFFIDYHYIGGNLRPDVTIIAKESEN